MRWGVTVLAIALLIALVWVSGCSNLSLGRQKVSDFGTVSETQEGRQAPQGLTPSLSNTESSITPIFIEPVSCEKLLACFPPASSGLITETNCQESRNKDNPHEVYTEKNYGYLDQDGLFIRRMSCSATDSGTYIAETVIKDSIIQRYRYQIPMEIHGYPGSEYIATIGKNKVHYFDLYVHTRFLIGCGWSDGIDESASRDKSLQYTNAFDFKCLEELG